MFDLKITNISEKGDLKALEGILRKMPGLSANQISIGLKYPPFKVFTTTGEEQARAMKNTLEKLGAKCEIEKVNIVVKNNAKTVSDIPAKEEEKKFQWRFLLAILGTLLFLIIASIYFSSKESNNDTKPEATPQQAQTGVALPSDTKQAPAQTPASKKADVIKAAKDKNALKHDLAKNSYDTEAWKTLAETLEEEGDTVAARVAKANYEKAVRTQKVLASLAKTFGNNVRVEITAAAVYYRTSKNFTESQFYLEAEKLRDSLSVKFPGKRNLVIENYTSDNKVQRVILEPNIEPAPEAAPQRRERLFF